MLRGQGSFRSKPSRHQGLKPGPRLPDDDLPDLSARLLFPPARFLRGCRMWRQLDTFRRSSAAAGGGRGTVCRHIATHSESQNQQTDGQLIQKHMATFKTFRAKRPISASAFLNGLVKPCHDKVNTLWFFFSSLIGLHSSSPSSLRFTLCAGRLDSPAALLPPSVHTQLSPSLCRPVQCFPATQPLPHHPPVPGGLANKNDWCH